MKEQFQGKRILITGGAGSIGSKLVEMLTEFNPEEVIVIDNNETAVFHLLDEFKGKIKAYVGSVADKNFVYRLMKDIDIVFHTAALKHVIIGERSPDSIVRTNIIGIQNLLDAALDFNVERFVFTSSDKAVNPTNVMGTSKLMGERLVTATDSKKRGQRTIFCSTRFGNVVGSRGGVFDIFKSQAKAGGPLTLTDKKMTRFIMTVPEAARLILEAAVTARGGEVFVTKMPVIRIKDLADAMIDMIASKAGHDPSSVRITEVGAKPGEKMYEELMSEEEVSRAFELDRLFVVLPAFRSVYAKVDRPYLQNSKRAEKAYISSREEKLSLEEIKDFLKKNKLVEV